MKIYLAAPFFNPVQVALVEKIEDLLATVYPGVEVFSPRKGKNALEMNGKYLSKGLVPPEPLKTAVFRDNYVNIEDASMVLAVIDDRDVGVLFELGFAYAKDVPILTYTDQSYGMNLMLAMSITAHTKGHAQLQEALQLFVRYFSQLGRADVDEADHTMAQILTRFKNPRQLREGWEKENER